MRDEPKSHLCSNHLKVVTISWLVYIVSYPIDVRGIIRASNYTFLRLQRLVVICMLSLAGFHATLRLGNACVPVVSDSLKLKSEKNDDCNSAPFVVLSFSG
jgi:hypothetical protein